MFTVNFNFAAALKFFIIKCRRKKIYSILQGSINMKTSRKLNKNLMQLKFCETCLNILYKYEEHIYTQVKIIAAIFWVFFLLGRRPCLWAHLILIRILGSKDYFYYYLKFTENKLSSVAKRFVHSYTLVGG